MDKIFLVHPNAQFFDKIRAYRRVFLERGESIDGTGGLADYEDIQDYLDDVRSLGNPEQLPPGRVLSSQFMAIRASDRKLLGMVQVRHQLNDYLSRFGGHIGYSVLPEERGRGIAKWMLRQALYYGRDVLRLDHLLVTCAASNYASARVMQYNGGVFIGADTNIRDGREMKKFRFDTCRLSGQALPWVFPPDLSPMRHGEQKMAVSEWEALLRKTTTGVLALGAGYPYALPLNFVYTEDHRLYLHTARAGEKLKRIAEDPRACFSVYQNTDRSELYTSVYRSAQIFGRLRLLSDETEIRRALTALCHKHNPGALPGLEEKKVEGGIRRVQMLELICEEVSGKQSSRFL